MKRIVLAILASIYLLSSLQCKQIALFSPDDKITSHLISYINNAQKRIYAAVYFITDKQIANALIKAKNERGLDVQIVTDQTSICEEFGKAQYLRQHNIDVFIYKPQTKTGRRPPLMHNKFVIIDDKICTGSFNWTVSANKRNQENVMLSDNPILLDRYTKQFVTLKKRCVYQPMLTHPKIANRKHSWYRGVSRGVENFVRSVRTKLSKKKQANV